MNREAGYSESVARKADAITSSSPAVQAAMIDRLEREGITNELLAQRTRGGPDATIVVGATLSARREIVLDFKKRRKCAAS